MIARQQLEALIAVLFLSVPQSNARPLLHATHHGNRVPVFYLTGSVTGSSLYSSTFQKMYGH